MGYGVAGDVEPLATAVSMAPSLAIHALRVVTVKEILRPLFVGYLLCRTGAFEVRLTTATEF